MFSIPLHFGVEGAMQVRLRSLTGADERFAQGDAHKLLWRLAEAGEDCVSGDGLLQLTVGDRDRAMAGLYGQLYSPNIIADTACGACDKPFELRFDLSVLVNERQPNGSVRSDSTQIEIDDAVYRLPRIGDLSGQPADLLTRLHVSGTAADVEAIETALEAADPALTLDLAGVCPECGAETRTPFSISEFLSAAIKRDAAFLWRETHLLARTYGWSLDTILALTRVERQTLVRLVLAESQSASRVRSLA